MTGHEGPALHRLEPELSPGFMLIDPELLTHRKNGEAAPPRLAVQFSDSGGIPRHRCAQLDATR